MSRKRRRRRFRPRLTSNEFYGVREASVRALGFLTYGDYLASRLWNDVRNCFLREMGWECQLCGDEATQVHHQWYGVEDLMGTRFDFLVAVCRTCHEKVEFTTEGKKRSGPGAIHKCRMLLKAARRRKE